MFLLFWFEQNNNWKRHCNGKSLGKSYFTWTREKGEKFRMFCEEEIADQ